MKFTLSWLKEHLETTASLSEITDRLTANGLVVDSVTYPDAALKGFKIVEIVEASRHPQADRLQVCRVNTGEEILQIVCGALNARAGLRTVLALPGLTIPTSGLVIRQSKIRDVESQGMLCSERELGLSESHAGILELDPEAPVGVEFSTYRGLDDPVIDIEITPNRGDCLSVRGIARDLAATGLGTLKPLGIPVVSPRFESSFSIKIEDPEGCPLFTGRLIRGVQNGPSPLWLQKKLRSVGLKSISKLVDVTNLMIHDRGRPMHVFDADRLHGSSLIIRNSRPGDTFKALNEEQYDICPNALVITDAQQICGLAGIMGGEVSGSSDQTVNVFLESALFDPVRIARTGQTLNILSDSRYRFERGVDAAIVEEVLEQATQLILDLCGGEASKIVRSGDLKKYLSHHAVPFRVNRVQTLGGLDLSADHSFNILKKLGFEAVDDTHFKVPTWRTDIKGEADLIEEILRIHGYDHISEAPLPAVTPQERLSPALRYEQQWHRSWKIRRGLVAQGHAEAYTWSFLKKEWATHFGGGDLQLTIRNPISCDMSDMRPSLLPLLLEALRRNISRGQHDAALFEIGTQYNSDQEAAVVTGLRGFITGPDHWAEPGRPVDIFDAKADVYTVIESAGFDPSALQIVSEAPTWYHPGRSGTLKLGPRATVAYFGELHPQTCQMFDLEKTVVGFEVFLEALPFPKKTQRSFTPLSPYQAVERDFAFLINKETPVIKLIQLIEKVDKELIKSVIVFDVYEGKGISEVQKSIGIRIRLEPQKSTLTDADITLLQQKIIDTTHQQLGAVLRS